MRAWLGTTLLIALSATGCSRRAVELGGRTCSDGTCIDGFTCDVDNGLCISVSDTCAPLGRTVACEPGTDDCSQGCRTCLDSGWGECETGSVVGGDCEPASIRCDVNGSLVYCSAQGTVVRTEPCGSAGCNVSTSPDRCNDCAPGSGRCNGALFVECDADGYELASVDCGVSSPTCAGGSGCEPSAGCQPTTPALIGTACDDGSVQDGNLCNSSCDGLGDCVALPVACDDGNPCTTDQCAAGACTHPPVTAGTVVCRAPSGGCDSAELCDGSPTCPADGLPTLQLSGPSSANVRQTTSLVLTLPCAGQSADISCTASSARYCLLGPLGFEGSNGGMTGTGVSNADCTADCDADCTDPGSGCGCLVSGCDCTRSCQPSCNSGAGILPTGCGANDGGGDVLRFSQTSSARSPRIVANGTTDLVVNVRAAHAGNADTLEPLVMSACCDVAGGCADQSFNINNADDGGYDPWGDRPCPSGTCSGAGYALDTATFDGCPNLWIDFSYAASVATETVQIDDLTVSGVTAPTLPLNDNGNGTYGLRFTACEAATVDVTCVWDTGSGTVSDAVTIAVTN